MRRSSARTSVDAVSRLAPVLRGVVIVVAALLAAACGGDETKGSGKPLVVYVNAPFSGTPFVGETIVRGAELGARVVNARGLNVGGESYVLKIKRVDNGLSPQSAVANVRRAVDDEAVAVVDEPTQACRSGSPIRAESVSLTRSSGRTSFGSHRATTAWRSASPST